VDGRCDIYALGVVLYELVTGRVPFIAKTPVAVIFKHVNDPLPPPREIDPTVPEAIERVILKAMAKEPVDRYTTSGDMVKALQAAIQATTTSSQQMGEPSAFKATSPKSKPGSRPIRRVQPKAPVVAVDPFPQPGPSQMMFWGVLSFLLAIVIGVALLGLWRFSQSGQAEETLPVPTQAQQLPADQLQLELPQAIPTPLPTPVATAVPQPAQPSSGQAHVPSPEAIEACRGAVVGVACSANLPGGSVTGTCQTPPGQQQLACIPAGGPPPPGQ
jgi:serine/threonine protein kinase